MVTKKWRVGSQIEEDIISLLKEKESPLSTREIAIRIHRAWHSVQLHCMKLQIEGKVTHCRISNLNVWQIKTRRPQL